MSTHLRKTGLSMRDANLSFILYFNSLVALVALRSQCAFLLLQRGRGAPAERSGDRVPPSGWRSL